MAVKTKVIDIDKILPILNNHYSYISIPSLPYNIENSFSKDQINVINDILSSFSAEINRSISQYSENMKAAISLSSYEVERCFLCSKKIDDSALPTAADLGIV